MNVIVLLFEQLHSFVFATPMIDDGWRRLLGFGRKEKKCFLVDATIESSGSHMNDSRHDFTK